MVTKPQYNLPDAEDVTSKKSIIIAIVFFVLLIIAVQLLFNLKGPNSAARANGQQEIILDVLAENNRALAEAAKRKEISDKLSITFVNQAEIRKNEQIHEQVASHAQVEEKVATIKKEFESKLKGNNDPIATVIMVKQAEMEVSTVRVTSLWINFCKYDNSQECKAFKK